MAKDIVQEAVEQAEAMKEAAYENAKSVLVNAMSTNLKAAVSEAIGDKINEDGNPKGANLNVNYDPEGLKDLDGDDLTDEGDGPAIIEAGVDEGDEYGGGKGDGSKSREDYEEGAVWEDEDEADAIDIDIDVDDDEDEDEDIDEVLEIIEDEDEDYGGDGNAPETSVHSMMLMIIRITGNTEILQNFRLRRAKARKGARKH